MENKDNIDIHSDNNVKINSTFNEVKMELQGHIQSGEVKEFVKESATMLGIVSALSVAAGLSAALFLAPIIFVLSFITNLFFGD